MKRTYVYIVCQNGEAMKVQMFRIPTENITGFHGDVSLKFQGGQATTVSVPRETLFLEPITKEDWEKTFGEINDKIERL